jgi:opacity protein-like surface antigen
VAAFATNASAGPVGTVEFNLGYMKSSNEMTTDGESMGGGIGLGASYWRSASPTVSWGAEVSYDNLGSVEVNYVDPSTTGNVTEEVNAKALRITPAVRMNFGSMVGPNFFAQGGAGFYNVSSEWNYSDSSDPSLSLTADDSSTEFGFNLGAGVGFPVGPKTRMNVQGQYHSVATEGESSTTSPFALGSASVCIGFGVLESRGAAGEPRSQPATLRTRRSSTRNFRHGRP